jgi:hypothetical protein
MHESLVELLPEILATLLYGVGALALSGAAVVLEQFGLRTAVAGEPLLGLWIGLFGLVVFYLGAYAMGYRDFLPRARSLAVRLRA